MNTIKHPINLAAAAAMMIFAAAAAAILAGCTGAAAPPPTGQVEATEQKTTPISIASPSREPSCTIKSNREPNPTVESLLSPVSDQDWTKGPGDAYVTILDYSDFQ